MRKELKDADNRRIYIVERDDQCTREARHTYSGFRCFGRDTIILCECVDGVISITATGMTTLRSTKHITNIQDTVFEEMPITGVFTV
jgi:hypothetical protein